MQNKHIEMFLKIILNVLLLYSFFFELFGFIHAVHDVYI
jgi:hypothetical protein